MCGCHSGVRGMVRRRGPCVAGIAQYLQHALLQRFGLVVQASPPLHGEVAVYTPRCATWCDEGEPTKMRATRHREQRVCVKGSSVSCRSPRSDGARPALTNNLLCVIPNTGAHVCLHLRVPAHYVGVPEVCPQTASVVCVLRLKQHRLRVFPVHFVRRTGRPGPPDSGQSQGFSAEGNNAPTISGRVPFPMRFVHRAERPGCRTQDARI